ncbi:MULTISPECIES: monodechloroaminopyrrolnitrin synthase PrnB family protein [unclassified Ensifer]|uniref:monodechloroaminopyrrolnitrin synthase PrnB family protein n=1 Tax=unclassified Ensifer TaxID=2633371 RepID=UPI00300F7F86
MHINTCGKAIPMTFIICPPGGTESYYRTTVIRSLDPLQADEFLRTVPGANHERDIPHLISLLDRLRASAETINFETPEFGHAAMRDIGIVLASLKRHGIEPIPAVPGIEPILLKIGELTDMVPRDTVHHYTSWNPDGARRRTYTSDPQERILQEAVVDVFPHLSASLTLSEELSAMNPDDARFAPLVNALSHEASAMVSSIDAVVKQVSPVFFAQTLRPYFEEITVAGEQYLGPAAAQVPLWLIDLCLWASDRNSPEYEAFLVESVKYSLPPWRAFFHRHRNSPSLVTKLSTLLEDRHGAVDENVMRSAESVAFLLRTLKVFRGRHLGIARAAYSDDIRLYDKGSGGAPVALLKAIIDLTVENERLVLVRRQPSAHHPLSAGPLPSPDLAKDPQHLDVGSPGL